MNSTKPKFPNVHVKFSDSNGNVFVLIGNTMTAMRRCGIDEDAITAFKKEAESGDYDHAIQTAMAYVEVD